MFETGAYARTSCTAWLRFLFQLRSCPLHFLSKRVAQAIKNKISKEKDDQAEDKNERQMEEIRYPGIEDRAMISIHHVGNGIQIKHPLKDPGDELRFVRF